MFFLSSSRCRLPARSESSFCSLLFPPFSPVVCFCCSVLLRPHHIFQGTLTAPDVSHSGRLDIPLPLVLVPARWTPELKAVLVARPGHSVCRSLSLLRSMVSAAQGEVFAFPVPPSLPSSLTVLCLRWFLRLLLQPCTVTSQLCHVFLGFTQILSPGVWKLPHPHPCKD